MRHVAITGTRTGMTAAQSKTLQTLLLQLLAKNDGLTIHHGGAVGADTQAHDITDCMAIPVVVHPATGNEARWADCRSVRPALKPLERNRQMMDECDTLLAFPRSFKEILRSGTWATIRWARKNDKVTVIVWPDGTWVWDTTDG